MYIRKKYNFYFSVVVIFRPKFLHSKHEEPVEVLSNVDAGTNDIKIFIDEKHLGLVGQMTPSNENMFSKPLIAVYYNIDWQKNLKVTFSYILF